MIKLNTKRYKLKFILNTDIVKKVVEDYSVTIKVVPTEEERIKNGINKTELLWDFKPVLKSKDGEIFIENMVNTELKNLKQLRFALYPREGYQGKILSKVISINNVILE